MKVLVGRALSVLRAGWLGLAGQGLTFIAMFAPLVWARFDQLSYLLVSSAGSTVLAYTVTLAFSSLFPRIADPGEMTTALRTSFAVMAGFSALLAIAAVVTSAWSPGTALMMAGWASMTFFQGCYLMATGLAVREGNYSAIPVGRLIYGLVLAVLTVLACVFGGPRYSLVAATCLAYALGAGYIGWVMRERLLAIASAAVSVTPRRALLEEGVLAPAVPGPRPSWWQYVKSSGEAGLSQALNGTASQLSVLILPGLGVYHNAWTAILRLVGGFGTVSMQLVAPALDIELSTSIRENDHARARGVLRRELLVGALVGVVAVLLSVLLFVFTPSLRGLDSVQVTTIVVCMVVYAISVLSISVMFNAMILVGGDRPRLVWAGIKSLCVLGVLFFGGSMKLVGSVVAEALFAVIYAVMVFRLNARSHGEGHESEVLDPPAAML